MIYLPFDLLNDINHLMPVIENSDYRRPELLFNRHLETIVPGLFRDVPHVVYSRERIDTRDGDFLDLDWIVNGHKDLIIISHGLEGDSQRPYVKGMAKAFSEKRWDVLAWNYRGCSGEMNNLPIFYHSGATYDLETVVNHAVETQRYERIVLIGYSLGGNMTLKYLGENSTKKFGAIKGAVAFSVPLDLLGCSRQIDKPYNILYSRRFLRSLKKKAREKEEKIAEYADLNQLSKVGSIYELDDWFTAPLHGFKDAEDYYEQCSSRAFVGNISVKTLVVNALNDPFLSDSCLDDNLFVNLKDVYFETPKHGGHCGFSLYNSDGLYWSEQRALQFVEEQVSQKS